MSTLTPPAAPALNSSRTQARALLEDVPHDLSEYALELDCSDVKATAPSFMDELVKAGLVERNAARLILRAAPPRTAELAVAAAERHRVSDRLTV